MFRQELDREYSPMSPTSASVMYGFLECTVRQYMTSALTTVTREVSMREIETLFEKHDFNVFPVVEDGKMLGIVTKYDFIKNFAFTTDQIVPPLRRVDAKNRR